MKKIISILLSVLICASLVFALPIVSTAEDAPLTEFVYGKHSVNPLTEAGMQGFTPVMTKMKTTGYDGAALTTVETIINSLATPPKNDALEENATRWGLSGNAWESVGQWNYTAVRSDGRIMPYRVAAGVRFDVTEAGAYNISADFFNNSMATGYIHYIVLKSGDEITTLYSFDTVTVEGTLHDISEGSRKQNITKTLSAGDEIYFLIDSKGEKASGVWPNLKVNIKRTAVMPEYVYGKHSVNPLTEAGMQGFTPVITKSKTTGYDGAALTTLETIIGTLATPPKNDALEENATRWGLSGNAWESVGQWNYTAIRSDGRVSPYRVAAGVRFDVPEDGKYTIKADFYNGSMATGYIHYIALKSGDTLTKLYDFDTATITDTTTHDIAKGTRVQKYELELKAGDELYFLMDSKGEKASGVYPNMEVIVTNKVAEDEDGGFKPTVANSYSYGGRALNEFGVLGMQNFFPVAGPAAEKAENYPINSMTVCEDLTVEENANRWGTSAYQWLGVRADGRVYPSKYTAGVKFVVPADDKYTVNAKFFGTQPRAGLIYGIYVKKTNGEIKLVYSEDTKGNSGERYEEATKWVINRLDLSAGDEVYFLIDSKGNGGSYYPYLRVNITPTVKVPQTGDYGSTVPFAVCAISAVCLLFVITRKNKANEAY